MQPRRGSLDAASVARLLPNLTQVGPTLAAQDPEKQFEYGLGLILDGLGVNHGRRPRNRGRRVTDPAPPA